MHYLGSYEKIREKPQAVVDRIRSFDPGTLVSETLGAPFRQALDAVEQVSPNTLIGQLDALLAAEKLRLKTAAAPSRVLAPVTQAFDAVLAEFDTLSPDIFLQPIETAIEDAIQAVIDAAPIDEVFDEIDEVFATIQAVLDTVTAIEEALRKSSTALGNLQNPDAAIDAWRDAALAKIDAVPNTAALDALLGEITNAIDAARGTDMLARFDTAVAPAITALDGLAAENALSRMVALRQRLLPLMRSLPAGAERSAIDAVLARFDPLDPAHMGGLRAASLLLEALNDSRARLDTMAAQFAETLHGADGTLTALRAEAADASLLRTAVEQDIETALAPIRYLVAQLGAAAVPLEALADGFADLTGRLTASVGDLLTGPASLQAITNAVQQVIDTVRSVDLAFLREALEGVFQSVRAEIESISPKPLLITLDREFGETIDALDLGVILPQAEIAALDQSVRDLITSLEGFDPAKLVGDAVGQSYRDDVLPLVEALDITPVFDALIEALRGLEVELEQEMGRINTAYGQLLSARPGGGSASNSLSLG